MGLVMFDDDGVPHSELQPVLVVDHNASSRAPCSWWNLGVPCCTTVTPMNKEVSSPAHLARLLGLQIEGTWSGNIGVHHVLAVGYFVLGSRERADVDHTLFVRV